MADQHVQYPGALSGTPTDDEIPIRHYLEILRRRRWIVVLSLVSSLVVASLLYVLTPKEYRASTTVQVMRRLTYMSFLDKAPMAVVDVDFLPTQLRILQSWSLAGNVVRNLRLAEDPTFGRSRSILGFGRGSTARSGNDAAATAAIAGQLQQGLEITPIKGTYLISIAYRSTSPQLAARVANGVAEAYIDWEIRSRSENVGRASSFLSSQIEALKQELQDKEAQLQAFSRRTDIASLDPALNATLEALNKDYGAALGERINREARYKELLAATPEHLARTASTPTLEQSRAEVAKLEQEYSSKMSVYKPDYPEMRELRNRIEQARRETERIAAQESSKLRDAARADLQAAQSREESVSAELARQKNAMSRQSTAAVEYSNLKVEVTTKRNLLNDLVRRQTETEAASRSQSERESTIVVIDPAYAPSVPFRPSLPRNLGLGIMIGLALGIGLVALGELLDRTIKSPDDAERVLGIPLLGAIADLSGGETYGYGYRRYGYGYGYRRRRSAPPKPGDDRDASIEQVPHLKPRSAVAEAYRALRTALLLSTAEELKTVVITSAVPGEGKSATASNLAVVLAQLGQDVLLIDADLRKARQHEVFKLSNRVGLVNYLTGGAEPAQIFLRTAVPNLYLTPAGPVPPNAAELLASDRMRHLLELARQRYAYVIIDTPPTLPVTDGTILGSMVDGVVLCLGAGLVTKEDASGSRDRLAMAGVKILGAVLNRLSLERKGYYSKHYYYRSYEAYTKQAEDRESGEAAVSGGR